MPLMLSICLLGVRVDYLSEFNATMEGRTLQKVVESTVPIRLDKPQPLL